MTNEEIQAEIKATREKLEALEKRMRAQDILIFAKVENEMRLYR